MRRKSPNPAMERLAKAEAEFLGSEFLAPVMRGRGVTVKIAGVRCVLTVHPVDFEGWGVFRAKSHSKAVLVREASATERRRYLRLLPGVRLIVCRVDGSKVRATPANLGDERFCFAGPVEVRICGRVDLFDTVMARFDGTQFWFEEVDARADAAAAAFLRKKILAMVDPREVERAGLGQGQRLAYAVEYSQRAAVILADRKSRADARLADALAHAGAILSDFTDAQDVYRVTFMVDGQRHTSVVRKGDLTVHSAGICLSGQDADFDLSSLVGVLREASGARRFVRY